MPELETEKERLRRLRNGSICAEFQKLKAQYKLASTARLLKLLAKKFQLTDITIRNILIKGGLL